jgi:hypothetical protein
LTTTFTNYHPINILPSDKWDSLSKGIQNAYRGFSRDELFGPDPGTVHNCAGLGKQLVPSNKGHVPPTKWKDLFQEAYEEKTSLATSDKGARLRVFGVRLCKSNPIQLFGAGMWTGHYLQDRIDTAAWAGAFQYFGTIWTHDPNELSLLAEFSDASDMLTSSEVEILVIAKKPLKPPELSDMEDSGDEEKTGLDKFFAPKGNEKTKLSPPKLLTADTDSVATAKATGKSGSQQPSPSLAKPLTKTAAKTQAKTLPKTQESDDSSLE